MGLFMGPGQIKFDANAEGRDLPAAMRFVRRFVRIRPDIRTSPDKRAQRHGRESETAVRAVAGITGGAALALAPGPLL